MIDPLFSFGQTQGGETKGGDNTQFKSKMANSKGGKDYEKDRFC